MVLLEWVKLRVCSEDQRWTARVVQAIVALGLAYPVLLGRPFLQSNKIVIDHEFDCVTAKESGYQLLPRVPMSRSLWFLMSWALRQRVA